MGQASQPSDVTKEETMSDGRGIQPLSLLFELVSNLIAQLA